MTDIKYCGLTRPEDARRAVELGAAFVGVIFAGGPRMVTPERAATVLRDVPASVARVGVFADQSPDEIAAIAAVAGLSIAQLHATRDAWRIEDVRAAFSGSIWAVARVENGRLPAQTAELIATADGLLLDTTVPGRLGGTGVALAWDDIAPQLEQIRGGRRVVLAGGLRPENVARAIAALAPDVVDVSSGIESAPGIKNHERMRAFRDAVMHASIAT